MPELHLSPQDITDLLYAVSLALGADETLGRMERERLIILEDMLAQELKPRTLNDN